MRAAGSPPVAFPDRLAVHFPFAPPGWPVSIAAQPATSGSLMHKGAAAAHLLQVIVRIYIDRTGEATTIAVAPATPLRPSTWWVASRGHAGSLRLERLSRIPARLDEATIIEL